MAEKGFLRRLAWLTSDRGALKRGAALALPLLLVVAIVFALGLATGWTRPVRSTPKAIVAQFKSKYGKNWRIQFDGKSKNPSWIYGSSIDTGAGKLRSERQARDVARDFIQENDDTLGIDSSNLRPSDVVRAGNTWAALSKQLYRGLPVFDSEVRVALTSAGGKTTINSVRSSVYPGIAVSVRPAISRNEAVGIAKLQSSVPRNCVARESELGVLPRKTENRTLYYLCWRVLLESSDAMFMQEFYIDARTRVLRDRRDRAVNYAHITGTIKGQIWPEHANDTLEERDLKHAYVDLKIFPSLPRWDRQVTDFNGQYDSAGAPTSTYESDTGGTMQLSTGLKGSYAEHRNWETKKGLGPHVHDFGSATVEEATHDWTWEKGNDTNLFYHVNRAHDQFKIIYGFNELDYPMVAESNMPTDNAFSYGTYIAFGNVRAYARHADVIYHEYSHCAMWFTYGKQFIGTPSGLEGTMQDEALADFFACSVSDDPTLGEEILPSPRFLVNDIKLKKLPTDIYEAYDYAQALSGAFWEIRTALSNATGTDQAGEKLVFQAALAHKPLRVADWLKPLLLMDDNPGFWGTTPPNGTSQPDNNLANGTPHDEAILKAFLKHELVKKPFEYRLARTLASIPKGTSWTSAVHVKNNLPVPVRVSLATSASAAGGWRYELTDQTEPEIAPGDEVRAANLTVTNDTAVGALRIKILIRALGRTDKATAYVWNSPDRDEDQFAADDNYEIANPDHRGPWPVDTQSDVGILLSGWGDGLGHVLGQYGISTAPVDVDGRIFGEETRTVSDLKVLCIGSGGMADEYASPSFRQMLVDFVDGGGVLLTLTTSRGREWSALPGGGIDGYGWDQDRACLSAGIQVQEKHEILSAITNAQSNIRTDGYFTRWPRNAQILLRRTKNGMPAMITYPYGRGRVIACTMFTDWLAEEGADLEEQNMLRDTIVWARDPQPLPAFATHQSTDGLSWMSESVGPLSVSVPLANDSSRTASKVKVILRKPSQLSRPGLPGTVANTTALDLVVAPGERTPCEARYGETFLEYLPFPETGIWQVSYELLDSTGDIVQPETLGQRLCVSRPYELLPQQQISLSLNVLNSWIPLGVEATWTIAVVNRSQETTELTLFRVRDPNDFQSGWDQGETITVPAGGTWSDIVALRADSIMGQVYEVALVDTRGRRQLAFAPLGLGTFLPRYDVDIKTDRSTYAYGEEMSVTVSFRREKIEPEVAYPTRTYTWLEFPLRAPGWHNFPGETGDRGVMEMFTWSYAYPERISLETVFGSQTLEGTSTRHFKLPVEAVGFERTAPAVTARVEAKVLTNEEDVGAADFAPLSHPVVWTGTKSIRAWSTKQALRVRPTIPPIWDKGTQRVGLKASNEGGAVVRNGTLTARLVDAGGTTVWEQTKPLGELGPTAMHRIFGPDIYVPEQGVTGTLKLWGHLNWERVWAKAWQLGRDPYELLDEVKAMPDASETVEFDVPVNARPALGEEYRLEWQADADVFDFTTGSLLGTANTPGSRKLPNSLLLYACPGFNRSAGRELYAGEEFQLLVMPKNAGVWRQDGIALTAAIPDVGHASGSVDLGADQSWTWPSTYSVPPTITAGLRAVSVAAAIDSSVVAFTYPAWTIASSLQLGLPKTSYSAGEVVTVTVSHTGGGAQVTASCEASLTSRRNDFRGTLPSSSLVIPGRLSREMTTTLPPLLTSGTYILRASARDEVTGRTTSLKREITISGTGATLEVSTDRDLYGNGEPATALAGVDIVSGAVRGGTLKLRIGGISGGKSISWQAGDDWRNGPGYVGATDVGLDWYGPSTWFGDYVTAYPTVGSSGSGGCLWDLGYDPSGTPNKQPPDPRNPTAPYTKVLRADESQYPYGPQWRDGFVVRWGNPTPGSSPYPFGIAKNSTFREPFELPGLLPESYPGWEINLEREEYRLRENMATQWDNLSVRKDLNTEKRQKFLRVDADVANNGSANMTDVLYTRLTDFNIEPGMNPDPRLSMGSGFDNWDYLGDSDGIPMAMAGSNGVFAGLAASSRTPCTSFDTQAGTSYDYDPQIQGPSLGVLQNRDADGAKVAGVAGLSWSLGSLPSGSSEKKRMTYFYVLGSSKADLINTYREADSVYSVVRLFHDAKETVDWSSLGISWSGNEPPGTTIKLATKTGNTMDELAQAAWSDYYVASGAPIASPNGRYLAIKAVLLDPDTSDQVVPVLNSVRVGSGDGPVTRTIWEKNVAVDTDSRQEVSEAIGALPQPGRYELTGELRNGYSQLAATASHEFYVNDGNICLTFNTDKAVYEPGETAVVTGSVQNRDSLAGADVALAFQADGMPVYADSVHLAASAKHDFTFNVSLLGAVPGQGVLISGTANSAEAAKFVAVDEPQLQVEVDAPDVAGREPFDCDVALTNPATVDCDVDVDIEGETQHVVIPAGETRLLTRQMRITETTTIDVTVTGDVNTLVERDVAFGEAVTVTPEVQEIYPEGTVRIPYTVRSTGSLNSEVDIRFQLGSRALTETVVVGAGQSVERSLTYDLVVGDYTLSHSSYFGSGSNPFKVVPEDALTLDVSVDLRSPDTSTALVRVPVANNGTEDFEGRLRLDFGFIQMTQDLTVPANTLKVCEFELDRDIAPAGTYRVVASAVRDDRVAAQDWADYTLAGPRFVIVDKPVDAVVDAGQTSDLTFTVRNIGDQRGEAGMRLVVSGLIDRTQTRYLASGEQTSVAFTLRADDDSMDEHMTGRFSINDETTHVPVWIRGAKVGVHATLDKLVYDPGDMAVLTLDITNQGAGQPEIYATGLISAETTRTEPFVLTDQRTVTLRLPVTADSRKIEYGVHLTTGRSLYLDTLLLRVRSGAVTVYTDKERYMPGERVTAYVDTALTGAMTASAPGFSGDVYVSGPTSFDFVLPTDITMGGKYIDWTLGQHSGRCLFSTYGYWAAIIDATTDKEIYDARDVVKLRTTVRCGPSFPGRVVAWIVDPDGVYTKAAEQTHAFVEGENDIEMDVPLDTPFSGQQHRLVCSVYADLSQPMRLHSRQLLFDVRPASLVSVATDKPLYEYGESVIVTVTAQSSGAFSGELELAVDEHTLETESVAIDGRQDFRFDLGRLWLGRRNITATLKDNGTAISSKQTTCDIVDSQAPAPPEGLAAVARGTGARLTWRANTERDLDGYHVYRDGKRRTAVPEAEPSFSDENLVRGVEYRYHVTAIDEAGNESGPSAPAILSLDETPPVTAVLFDGTRTGEGWYVHGVRVSFSAADNAGGSGVDYTEYKLNDATDWTTYDPDTPLRITTEGVTSIKFRSVDRAGNLEQSNSGSVDVRRDPALDTGAPTAPALSGAADGMTRIRLSWTASRDDSSGIDGYTLYDSSTDDVVATTEKLSHAVEGLAPATTRSFYVRAYDYAGNYSERSNVIAATTKRPPDANAGGPYEAVECAPVTFDGSLSADADGDPLQYRWDFTGDGTWDTQWSPLPTAANVWQEDCAGVALLQVSDGEATDADFAGVVVQNAAPQVRALAYSDTLEGSGAYVTATFTDAGALDTHEATIDWGDGTMSAATVEEAGGSGAVAGNHIYADNGNYAVTVTVTDDDGAAGTATCTVRVHNLGPALEGLSDRTAVEGESVSIGAPFSDEGTRDTHSATIEWGDGTTGDGTVEEADGSGTVTGSHVYADNGTYTARVTVRDDDGGTGTRTFDVAVDNAAPQVEAGPDLAGQEGSTLSLRSTFGDAGTGDTHVARIEWGDGTAVSFFDVATSPLEGAHTYADNGVYTLTVTVTDDDDGAASDTCKATITNVQPTADAGPDRSVTWGDEVVFQGSFTDPGTLDDVSGSWDFGDGASASSFVTTHSFANPGIYNVTLTATDKDGAQGTDEAVVTAGRRSTELSYSGPPSGHRGGTIEVSARLVDDRGVVVTGAGVDFTLGSQHATAVTDSFGWARADMTIDQPRGAKDVSARFDGNDRYLASATSGVFTVVNRAPIAKNLDLATDEDTAKELLLAASDPDGDAITYAVVTRPSHGKLTGSAPNLTYTPDADFHGADSFTYKANDGTADSESASVEITVRPINDPPVALADLASTREEEAVTIAVLGNDYDVDGDSLSVTASTVGAHGSTAVNPDNTITYTPDANYNGTDWFNYTISDGKGGSASTRVEVDVAPVNDPPVLDPIADQTLDEAASLSVAVRAFDIDGDPMALAASGLPGFADFIDNGDGTGTLALAPGYGDAGRYPSISITASDGKATDSKTLAVTVNNVNRAPVAAPVVVAGNEDAIASLMLEGSDPDGEPLTFMVVPGSGPAHGTLTGTTPALLYTPDLDWFGVDSFDYSVTDPSGAISFATVTITVAPVNDAAVAVDDDATTPEDTPITISVLANDSDTEGDTLSVASVTRPAHGTAVANADGTITYRPAANWFGTEYFNYAATDGKGGDSQAAVYVTVTPANDPPAAEAGANQTVDENAIVRLAGAGSDVDGENLTYAWTQTAGPAVVLSDSSAPAPTFTAPEVTADTVLTFALTVSDGAAIAQDSVNVTVKNVVAGGFERARSKGYWKNHPEQIARLLLANGQIDCGDSNVKTVTQAVAILADANTKDARYMLRAQLLATLLNVANNSDPMVLGYDIRPVVSQSRTFLATHANPVTSSHPDRATCITIKDKLDRYNNSGE